jgi:hypothetical protein
MPKVVLQVEGNQGPYKLKGQNGELYVLVISGSEAFMLMVFY